MSMMHTNLVKYNSFSVAIDKFEFERLKYPYDTNCIDYKTNLLYDCLNQCYHDQYLAKLKCIPFVGSLFSFTMGKNILNETIFCKSRSFNYDLNILSQNITFECSVKCGTPCTETYYSITYQETQRTILSIRRFYLSRSYYLKVKYSPKKSFYSLVIDLANIWCLYYGISFIQLMKILFKSQAIKIIHFFINKINQAHNYFKLKVSY